MPGRRRLLQHLLVAPLHGAIPLEQVHHVAVGVGEDLELDVSRPDEVVLHQHMVVAEARFASRWHEARAAANSEPSSHDAHALAAAAGTGLDQHRKPDRIGLLLQEGRILVVAVIPWDQGHACAFSISCFAAGFRVPWRGSRDEAVR